MEAFNPWSLVIIGQAQGLTHALPAGTPRGQEALRAVISSEKTEILVSALNPSLAIFSALGLPVSHAKLDRMTRAIQADCSFDDLKGHFAGLLEILEIELSSRLFLQIPTSQASFYQEPIAGWETTIDKFGSLAIDIEEASKCIALNRFTSAVFHLMRIMEAGLRALGNSLNDERLNPARNPNWESILKKCDEELAKPLADRSDEWRTDEMFYSGAAARLRAVKDAWRNPTMHIETVYTEETAIDVWHHTQAFMRHLATKLGESA